MWRESAGICAERMEGGNFMSDCHSGCGGCAGGCGGCGCGPLEITQKESVLLRLLGQTPFLPMGKTASGAIVCREEGVPEHAEEFLPRLEQVGLVRLDDDIPLVNFTYAAYEDCLFRGSMALTRLGQNALEALEIQGPV